MWLIRLYRAFMEVTGLGPRGLQARVTVLGDEIQALKDQQDQAIEARTRAISVLAVEVGQIEGVKRELVTSLKALAK